MKKSQKLMLLQIAAAFNKAQGCNDTMPFYSENPGMAGFRYLNSSIDPYAAFSPTLFDKVEEIDEDDLHEDIATEKYRNLKDHDGLQLPISCTILLIRFDLHDVI